MMIMIVMVKQLAYAFLFFALIMIYIVFHLSVLTIRTRRKTSLFVKNMPSKLECTQFIATQKLHFLTGFLILKLIGIILFILCTLRMAIQLTSYLDAAELNNFTFDPITLTNAAWEFIVTNEFFLIIMMIPWIVYTVFRFILDQRIIKLRLDQME